MMAHPSRDYSRDYSRHGRAVGTHLYNVARFMPSLPASTKAFSAARNPVSVHTLDTGLRAAPCLTRMIT